MKAVAVMLAFAMLAVVLLGLVVPTARAAENSHLYFRNIDASNDGLPQSDWNCAGTGFPPSRLDSAAGTGVVVGAYPPGSGDTDCSFQTVLFPANLLNPDSLWSATAWIGTGGAGAANQQAQFIVDIVSEDQSLIDEEVWHTPILAANSPLSEVTLVCDFECGDNLVDFSGHAIFIIAYPGVNMGAVGQFVNFGFDGPEGSTGDSQFINAKLEASAQPPTGGTKPIFISSLQAEAFLTAGILAILVGFVAFLIIKPLGFVLLMIGAFLIVVAVFA